MYSADNPDFYFNSIFSDGWLNAYIPGEEYFSNKREKMEKNRLVS